MLVKVVSLLRSKLVVLVAVFLMVAALTPSLLTRAADPTDAAGLIGAITGIYTAFPILTIVVTAFAIAGIALFLVRRGKTAAR